MYFVFEWRLLYLFIFHFYFNSKSLKKIKLLSSLPNNFPKLSSFDHNHSFNNFSILSWFCTTAKNITLFLKLWEDHDVLWNTINKCFIIWKDIHPLYKYISYLHYFICWRNDPVLFKFSTVFYMLDNKTINLSLHCPLNHRDRNKIERKLSVFA